MEEKKRILVAPMNWGLGHASRCVPVIRELISMNHEVIIAADGRALSLLRNEFPKIEWIRLPGYNIKYWWNGNAVLQILLQIPNIIFTIYKERKWLDKIIEEERINNVISDNRYGLYSKKIVSVFITHQLCIQLPRRFKWMEKFVYRLNKKMIERFDECWIPDHRGNENLSGNLSHQFPAPGNAFFTGPLSRFHYVEKDKERDLLIVISGTENQRTAFERQLTTQVKKLPLRILMVRGIPGSNYREQVTENFSKVDHLNAEELNEAFLTSKLIVARSGYSTIMDLTATRSKAILIPTRGQTEQEYLAEYVRMRKFFYTEPSGIFNLISAMEKIKEFNGIYIITQENLLAKRIESLVERKADNHFVTGVSGT